MYHHDPYHTGVALTSINSTNVSTLIEHYAMSVDGLIRSVPAIVNGKAYVGTFQSSTGDGVLYQFDLSVPIIEWRIILPSKHPTNWARGIGSTPAVVDGKLYVTALDAQVYRIDIATQKVDWVVDLYERDLAHNQPCDNSNPGVACWTSPLVLNGRVYVGIGLGEDGGAPYHAAFGFVYCLSAADGHVLWLYCTNKFADVAQNSPNDIPPSLVSGTLPAGFTKHRTDPPSRGASVWSSPAFAPSLNRLYVGTGNPWPDAPLPSAPYSSGCLSLDAGTGAFAGFFQPISADSYRGIYDNDVDMPSSPLVFANPRLCVAIGSKNGSMFILDAGSMMVLARRQMLPYWGDNPNVPLLGVDFHGTPTTVGENHSGTYSSPAVDYARGRLFVGLGGWSDPHISLGIDTWSTPFVRAMNWRDLTDVWPATRHPDGITRYNIPGSPLYQTTGECGLSSAVVANDILFVTTNKPALYAFRSDNGLLVWEASNLNNTWTGAASDATSCLGAAVDGNFVALGCTNQFLVYELRGTTAGGRSGWFDDLVDNLPKMLKSGVR